MSWGTDHDHRGEYADTRHDHDGDYAEKYHHHRDLADDHADIVAYWREDLEAMRAETFSREAVSLLLEAFRLDMRAQGTELEGRLEQVKTGLVTRFEALRDRLNESLGQLEAAQERTAKRLDRLEAALDALEADEADEGQAPELGHAAALAAALERDPADVPPNICPGGC